MTPIQLQSHALDTVYAALERLNSTVSVPADSFRNGDDVAQIGTSSGRESNPAKSAAVDSFQRTPAEREAFIRAEMVKDRERKGYT